MRELTAWILACASLLVVVVQSLEIVYWRRRCRRRAEPGRVVFDSEGGFRVEC